MRRNPSQVERVTESGPNKSWELLTGTDVWMGESSGEYTGRYVDQGRNDYRKTPKSDEGPFRPEGPVLWVPGGLDEGTEDGIHEGFLEVTGVVWDVV